MMAGILDLGCHGYNNKHVGCTANDVPSFVAMVTIITIMACIGLGIETTWLSLGKGGDLGSTEYFLHIRIS